MAAMYLWPEKNLTYDEVAKYANWHKGFVVWGFPVWRWMMDQGAYITDYDVINYEAWTLQGVKGYQKTAAPEHADWVINHTFDMDEESKNIKLAFSHPNFTYVHKKVTWNDVIIEHSKPGICDITMNPEVFDKSRSGLHRVLLLDITNEEVVFHDPRAKGLDGACARLDIATFRRASVEAGDQEICRYSLEE